MGACRKAELHGIQIDHVVDQSERQLLTFSLYKTKNKLDRVFFVDEEFYPIVKKYMALRPKHVTTKQFFIHYRAGVCTNQNVGEHTFSNIPRAIAMFLELESPFDYTGHTFRHTCEHIPWLFSFLIPSSSCI